MAEVEDRVGSNCQVGNGTSALYTLGEREREREGWGWRKRAARRGWEIRLTLRSQRGEMSWLQGELAGEGRPTLGDGTDDVVWELVGPGSARLSRVY